MSIKKFKDINDFKDLLYRYMLINLIMSFLVQFEMFLVSFNHIHNNNYAKIICISVNSLVQIVLYYNLYYKKYILSIYPSIESYTKTDLFK